MDIQENHARAAETGTLIRDRLKKRLPNYVRFSYGLAAILLLIWWATLYLLPNFQSQNLVGGLPQWNTSSLMWLLIIVGLGLLMASEYFKSKKRKS